MRIKSTEGPTGRENGEGGSVNSAAVTTLAELSLGEIRHEPLPHLESEPLTRFFCRSLTAIARRFVLTVEGPLDALHPGQDPCVMVLNHNQRLESVLVPGLMLYYRGGKPVHFFADWNVMLIPFIALLYRRARTIIVTRKQARPRFLNILKPLFRQSVPAFQQALDLLRAGGSVGVFPEGTMNRDPQTLLRGRTGAARLALEAGVPVQPLGIRFPGHKGGPIGDGARMRLVIGRRFRLPGPSEEARPSLGEVRRGHRMIMEQLSALSGKKWPPRAVRKEEPCP